MAEYIDLTVDELEKRIGKVVRKEVSRVPIGEPDVEGKGFEAKRSRIGYPRSKIKKDERGLPVDEFSFVRALEAMKKGEATGPEREAFDAGEKKALVWASGSGGGYFVDSEYLPEEFISTLDAAIVCRKAGCKVIQAQGSPFNIPKVTSGATAYWVTQNADIPASDPTPGQLQLSPHWAVARTQLSQFLVQSSAGAAEQIIREELAKRLALAVDDAMLEGDGSSGKPTGMAFRCFCRAL